MTPSTLNERRPSITDSLTSIADVVRSPLRAASFWTAVVLPFVYVPLLAGGLSGGETSLFAALVVANALTLLAGHNHGR